MPNKGEIDLIEGWTLEELEDTASQDTGAGDDSDLPSHTRFKRAVQRVYRKSIEQNPEDDKANKCAIFFLTPKPEQDITTYFEPMLDSGHESLINRVWFVTDAVVSGFRADIPVQSDAEIFDWVISGMNFGSVPAILINPKVVPTQFRFYPNGLADNEKCESWYLENKKVEAKGVQNTIDHYHKMHLITPDAQTVPEYRVWNDKSYPKSNSERLIQGQVQIALANEYKDCVVRVEVPSKVGRYDICITKNLPPDIMKVYCVLELKVLRSHTKSGNKKSLKSVHDWVSEGIDQARSYQKEFNANWAALCCFDMRVADLGETCFVHIKTKADKLGVARWRWYLYSTSKSERKANAQSEMDD